MKKDYELMVVIKPMLPEDIRSGVEKKLKAIIKKHDNEIVESDVWGKKHLAYPIKKHEEGYYIVYKLKCNPETVHEMGEEIKIINDILRYMLIREDNQ